jgi:hypothetical protein
VRSAWDQGRRAPLCAAAAAGASPVQALATDEAGGAWAGNARGAVRRVLLIRRSTAGGGEGEGEYGLGFELRVAGALAHTGRGTPEVSASAPTGGP